MFTSVVVRTWSLPLNQISLDNSWFFHGCPFISVCRLYCDNSLQFVINSCFSKMLMIKCDDDMRYCQNVFGCLPVADIIRRRTCKFLQKFDALANVICQACTRRWYSCHCLVKCFFPFLSHLLLSTSLWWNKIVYKVVYVFDK